MTDIQILKQAITKAINRGYKNHDLTVIPEMADTIFHNKQAFNVIFSHDFAKAFWGEMYSGIDHEREWQKRW